MAVLDRSWYGRVLVERVEGFASKRAWKRAYDEINAFEQMLHEEHLVLVKFWLHISDAEQLERFEARRDDPLKAWKLTDEDWRNRAQAGRVRGRGRRDARAHQSTPHAPWTVVEAESKRFARVKVAETVADRLAVAARPLTARPLSGSGGARRAAPSSSRAPSPSSAWRGGAAPARAGLPRGGGAALRLGQVLARVAGDDVADDEEQGEQAAADREEQRPVRVGLLLRRRRDRRHRRLLRRGLRERPEGAAASALVVLRERGRRGGEEDEQREEGGEASHARHHGRA